MPKLRKADRTDLDGGSRRAPVAPASVVAGGGDAKPGYLGRACGAASKLIGRVPPKSAETGGGRAGCATIGWEMARPRVLRDVDEDEIAVLADSGIRTSTLAGVYGVSTRTINRTLGRRRDAPRELSFAELAAQADLDLAALLAGEPPRQRARPRRRPAWVEDAAHLAALEAEWAELGLDAPNSIRADP
jgi:hypothetical protein